MFALILALVSYTPAHAAAEFDNSFSALKAKAVTKFLAEANNPASAVGQVIAKENADNTDGRNPDGIIRLPVKAGALQVTVSNGENLMNPWHYGRYENGKCLSGGDSATFLIALTERTGVHGASDMSTLLFQASANYQYSFDVKKEPESCQEAVDGAKILKAINVDEIKQVKIAE